MDKKDLLTSALVNLRDCIEDLLDELVPPPAEELHEAALSEAPPERGVAESRYATPSNSKVLQRKRVVKHA